MITRRSLLLAGAGVVTAAVAGVGADVLPGRVRVEEALGRGRADPVLPPAGGVTVRTAQLASARRGRDVTWLLATPDGADHAHLPLVVSLHGRGDDARSSFGSGLALDRYLAAHLRAGRQPLAVVSVDGGSAYWHPRADGDDPIRMVTAELLPALRAAGLRGERLGLLGWSMGGFGALLWARESAHDRLGGVRVTAAAASSPALFASAGATSPGSFDGPADWARYGALAGEPGAAGVALSVSCGDLDPFVEQVRRYRGNARPRPAGSIGPGRHEMGYWRAQVPDQLAFLAARL